MIFKPYRHQQLAYDFAISHERCCLFLGMGLGKTIVTLSVLEERLHDEFTVGQCLVVAPKNVAENVWAQECTKWEHTKGIRCAMLTGPAERRRRALESRADLYVINRENVVWLASELHGDLSRFQMLVLDELSSFKSSNTKRWRALRRAIKPIRYRIGLTGTPAPNTYLDLWPELYLIDDGETLGKTLGAYRDRYFMPGAHNGHIVYEYKLRMGAQSAINRQLKPLCLSMSAEDWLSLPPVLTNVVHVGMDTAARKRYDAFKREKVLPLLTKDDGSTVVLDAAHVGDMDRLISAETAATLSGKLLQMANGAVYDDEHTVFHIHDAKLDALDELIEANAGENLLVFYSYQHDRDRILARFPQAHVFGGPGDVDAWNRGEIPLLLCHPASTGHGLNLQHGGHIIVWFGLTWSLELYQQANARLPRPGQERSVIIHHIVCSGTIDDQVMAALERKDTGQRALLDALKEHLGGGKNA